MKVPWLRFTASMSLGWTGIGGEDAPGQYLKACIEAVTGDVYNGIADYLLLWKYL